MGWEFLENDISKTLSEIWSVRADRNIFIINALFTYDQILFMKSRISYKYLCKILLDPKWFEKIKKGEKSHSKSKIKSHSFSSLLKIKKQIFLRIIKMCSCMVNPRFNNNYKKIKLTFIIQSSIIFSK